MPVNQFWARRFATLALLVLAAACGGGGDGASSPVFGTASTIFVGDAGQHAIGSSSNSNPSPGTAVIQRVVSGPNTMLSSGLIDFAISAPQDRLYVVDLRSILAFDNISTISGNVAPRVISSFAPPGNFVGIDRDSSNDRIYAAVNIGPATNQVQVFDSVTTASNVLPTRTFSFASNFLIDVAIDPTRNILYVYHVDSITLRTEISVFDNATSLSTNGLLANRVITIGDPFTSGTPAGIFIDPTNDRLYAPRLGQVMVFDNASTKNGDVATTAVPRTILLPVPAFTNITVNVGADRVYAVDTAGLNIISNANSTSPTAVRALAPSGSLFTAVAVKP